MKVAVLVALMLAVLASSSALAQEATPDVPPRGDFTADPASGPVGTVVTLRGDLDQDIHSVSFQCIYRDTSDVGMLQVPLEPTRRSFELTFQIPAMLGLRQRGGETRATLVGSCEFLATSSHQLLFKAIPFQVTASLPSTGSGPYTSKSPIRGAAGLLLVGAGLLVLALAWRRQPA